MGTHLGEIKEDVVSDFSIGDEGQMPSDKLGLNERFQKLSESKQVISLSDMFDFPGEKVLK
jgi:hypothetical protein